MSAQQMVENAVNMTEGQKRQEFYNILEQLLELLENNCDEGTYLEGANMLKDLTTKASFNTEVITIIQVLRSTRHYQQLERARPRGDRPAKDEVTAHKYACEKCGRTFYQYRKQGQSDESFYKEKLRNLKIHQERNICKSIQDERRQVAKGSAIVCYNERMKKMVKATKTIQKWYRSL